MSNPLVCVVILAYNNVGDTLECLESVDALAYPNRQVSVVDNGSTDGTFERVRERFPSVEVVRTEVNRGVPGGFNLGIEHALRAGADYILLLNNDTAVTPDLLGELVRAGEVDRGRAILMPKVLYYDHPDLVWSAGARYRRFPPAIVFIGRGASAGRHDLPRLIDYAPTCGLLIRREAFERVGMFDDGYLFYYDDWDFCDRVRRAGLEIAYVPRATMRHKVSRTIRSHSPTFWRTWGASCVRYYRRHGRPVALDLTVHLGYIVLRELAQGNYRSLPNFLQGARAGLRQPLGPYPQPPSQEPAGAT